MHDTAGAGSPAPAVSSADVVAPEARVELERIARRWGELPVARAEGGMPLLRAALADLAARSAPPLIAPQPRQASPDRGSEVAGTQEVGVVARRGDAVVPDLGPAVVVDQLCVLVWDAYAAGHGDGIPDLLTDLRRTLA